MKKSKKRVAKSINNVSFEKEVGKDLNFFEKEVNNEVNQVEKWVLARRKFFIKLIFVLLFITLLLLVANFLG